jgi:hypothetical protein
MIRALYSAATGMQAQQKNLEVIANNLANVNTTGFKRSRAEFQDLLYQSEKPPGADQGNGNLSPSGVQIGHGSRLVSTTKLFTTGELTNTGDKPMRMIYVYGPAGDVAHWKQELEGTLPKAGIDVPALPAGAQPQCTQKP